MEKLDSIDVQPISTCVPPAALQGRWVPHSNALKFRRLARGAHPRALQFVPCRPFASPVVAVV
jgi:hypothetical protein